MWELLGVGFGVKEASKSLDLAPYGVDIGGENRVDY
jgi:hypothetical protein